MAAIAATKRGVHKLITIRFSHFNEKARWALDWHRVPYIEDGYLPILSTWGVIKNGGLSTGKSADKASTRLSTPLLVTPKGERIHNSAEISMYADKAFGTPATSLYEHPQDPSLRQRVLDLEREYHDRLGTHTRRVAYSHLLQDVPLLFECFEENCGPRQTRMLRLLWPQARGALGRLGLDQERVARSRDAIFRAFDDVGARLHAHKGDFLLPGERFTAADISFCALAAPVLMVQPWEGFGGALPPIDRLSDDFRSLVAQLRSHEAGQYAVRMFRTHRGERQIPGSPPLLTEPPHDILGRAEDGEGLPGGRHLGPEGASGGRGNGFPKAPGGGIGPGVVAKAFKE